jgi:hypothetical protein
VDTLRSINATTYGSPAQHPAQEPDVSNTNTESNADNLADDLMIGLGPIGEFWGFNDKWQTRRMLQYMPGVFRLGKHWCQRKSVARKGIEERERQNLPTTT